jgi:hypothetical protein
MGKLRTFLKYTAITAIGTGLFVGTYYKGKQDAMNSLSIESKHIDEDPHADIIIKSYGKPVRNFYQDPGNDPLWTLESPTVRTARTNAEDLEQKANTAASAASEARKDYEAKYEKYKQP